MPYSDLKRKLSAQLSESSSVSLRFTYFDLTTENLVLGLISQSLAICQLGYIENVVFTVFREVINNAQKANLKRVFFQKRNTNLLDPEAYATLMEEFKHQAVVRIHEYKIEMENSGLWMEFSLQIQNNIISIKVTNNVEMTTEEWTRVVSRIELAAEMDSLEDAFDSFGDEMEGEGIGIALNLVLLKSVGIDPKNFQMIRDQEMTTAQFCIPSKIHKEKNVEIIRELILQEVRAIPPFPTTVNFILKACSDSKTTLDDIAKAIESDAGLATEVLKTALDAGVLPNRDLTSIQKACQILGLKGIYELVSMTASKNILSERFIAFEIFWESSQRCSSYVRSMVRLLKLEGISDAVYLAALFHDIGRILLYSLKPEELKLLDGLSLDLNQPGPSTLEEIHLGIPHTVIGSMIAEKWGYPSEISQIILNYHRPLVSPTEIQRETALVYIAQAMVTKGTPQDRTELLDLNALALVGIENVQDLSVLYDGLQNDFASFLERHRENIATASL